MKAVETKIAELLQSRMPGPQPKGLIKCEAGSGSTGYSGSIEAGAAATRKKLDFSEILNALPSKGLEFSDLLLDLRELSKREPDGPWYRCNIRIDGSRVAFDYFWQGAPFSLVRELEPNIHGTVPHFVFEQRFDRDLVEQLSDFDLNQSLFLYVPAQLNAGRTVPPPLLEIFAMVDWLSDVNNGTMDQYFAREYEGFTGRLARAELYEKTWHGLQRIGHEAGAALFAESIALYAHFHSRVEKARTEMGIPAVARQEKSDIMSRYYGMLDSIEAANVAYIRQHIGELEQPASMPAPPARKKAGYSAMVLGATGNVGGCIVQRLVENPLCKKVVVVTRRRTDAFTDPKVVEVVVDMDRLVEELAPHAQGIDIALAAFGVGKGTAKMSEEELRRIEVGYLLAFCNAAKAGGARVCGVMTAVGADPASGVKYVKIIGEKEKAVEAVGFDFLGVYRPSVILGNSNTPGMLGGLMRLVDWVLPSRYHSIDKDEIARAMVGQSEQAFLALARGETLKEAVKVLEYREMQSFFAKDGRTSNG